MLVRRTTGGQIKNRLGNEKFVQNQKKYVDASTHFLKIAKKDKRQHDFLILGATGLQGMIVSRELIEKGYKVILSDKTEDYMQRINEKHKNIPFIKLDLEKDDILEGLKKSNAKIVVNCSKDEYIPKVLNACMEADMHHIDLGSYIPEVEKILNMHEKMKEKQLIGITGCGSTPGIGNIMLKYAANKLDVIDTIEAGFAWDSNIKEFVVPFSMDAIFYEFVTPAHIVENGQFILKNPLENIERRRFKGVGEQMIMPVAHSEQYTFYHYYKDKGLKNIRFYGGFPQHSFDKIVTMIELGFYGEYKKMMVNGVPTYVSDLVADLLREKERPRGYKEVENLWVNIYGMKARTSFIN